MESKQVTLINELDVSQVEFTIKVRVIRLMKQLVYGSTDKTFRIDMILLDKQGSKIKAQVPPRWVSYFERMLEEDVPYYIKNPQLGFNTANTKFVKNDNKINFHITTRVRRSMDFNGSLYGFLFVSFEDILDKKIDDKTAIDVIGEVVRCFELERFTSKNNKLTLKMKLELQSVDSKQVNVTLWDEYAQQFADYVSNNPQQPRVILIIQCGKLSYYKDFVSVTNWYSASRLFINVPIQEIQDFTSTLLANRATASTSTNYTGGSYSILYSDHDEYLNKFSFRQIADISEVKQEQFIICTGVIKLVCNDMDWYYYACKNCHKKALRVIIMSDDEESGNEEKKEEKIEFFCTNPNCGDDAIVVIPRFKITIRVQDSSGVVSLTMFDRDAKKLLMTDAQNLVDKMVQEGSGDNFPSELSVLLDKKFAFKIKVSSFNMRKQVEGYAITKMTDDTTIIEELEKRVNLEEIIQGDSYNNATSEFHSQETANLKEDMSFTGDNTTPHSTLQKTSPTTPNAKGIKGKDVMVHDLKRNLVDVYDVENHANMSTSKKPSPSTVSTTEEEGKITLLTPKTEK